MKVLMPDEVEAQNIITAKELGVVVKALDRYLEYFFKPSEVSLARSAKRKIERVLAQLTAPNQRTPEAGAASKTETK